MKVILGLFFVVFLAQNVVLGNDDGWACVEEIFRELEVDLESLGEMAGDFVSTLSRLRDGRQRCFDILGDPPTSMQERLHEACMLAWRGTVIYEVARMRRRAQNTDAQEIFEQLAQDIFECLDAGEDEIPDLRRKQEINDIMNMDFPLN
ncbi:hypothetical protein DMENIID0001_090930 [Sergentomyia squamirostris]